MKLIGRKSNGNSYICVLDGMDERVFEDLEPNLHNAVGEYYEGRP